MKTLSVVDLRLLDKEENTRELGRVIDKALTNDGAFYVVGIEGYDVSEVLFWIEWVFSIPEKIQRDLVKEHVLEDQSGGCFVVQPQTEPTKEGYGNHSKILTLDVTKNPTVDVSARPNCAKFEHVMQNYHAINVQTVKTLMKLIADSENLDRVVSHMIGEMIGQYSLQLFRTVRPDAVVVPKSDLCQIPANIYQDVGLLSLCTTSNNQSVQIFTEKTPRAWEDVQPIEGGILVCAGQSLAAHSGGKFHSAQYRVSSSVPISYHAEMVQNRTSPQPLFNRLLNYSMVPDPNQNHIDGVINSESVLTMTDSLLDKRLSDYLISPIDNKKDIEASLPGFEKITEAVKKRHHSGFGEEGKETFWSILGQVIFPFLMAGMGMVGAGLVLDIVQHWKVFKEVTTLFIMVPALLGLKGNLEMTLASRLSTQANLGHMEERSAVFNLVKTNLALIQVQAIIVGLLASFVAMVMEFSSGDDLTLKHGLLLCCSAITTASAASLVLGLIMMVVIVISHKYKVNPDNIATPIAASLGDLLTLGLLASFASLLYKAIDLYDWLLPAVIGLFISVIPLFAWIATGHKQTKLVLKTGWGPILSAMMISSAGGLILDQFVHRFKAFAVFQPVISGVGGNLVAVQASRISTWLHQHGTFGDVPEKAGAICSTPCKVFFQVGPHTISARVLLLLVIPGQIIFSVAIKYLKTDENFHVHLEFICMYVFGAFLQVFILLYAANGLVLFLWRKRVDPDNAAIPFLTSFGDLLGASFLACAFCAYDLIDSGSAIDGQHELSHNVTEYFLANETVTYIF